MPGGIDMSIYVTRDELVGRLEPLGEIRGMLREEINRLHAGQQNLSTQLSEVGKEITTRQDEANHRTTHNEEAVEAAHNQIAEVSVKIAEVQSIVTSIKKKGCDQKENHVEVLNTMAAAGMVPDTGELLEVSDRKNKPWTKRHAVGFGLGGLSLGAIAPHLGQILDWAFHAITGLPK